MKKIKTEYYKTLEEKIELLEKVIEEIDNDEVTSREIMLSHELVKYTSIPLECILELKIMKKIPFYDNGDRTYFYREDIDKWLRNRKLSKRKIKMTDKNELLKLLVNF